MIKMYKTLGVKLIENGIRFLQRAFHLIPKKITQSYIKSFLAGLGMPLSKIWWADRDYFYTDIETMREIIYYDWTDKGKYVPEMHDCDGFALHFKSHLEEIYGITAVALARGIKIEDINTGKPKGYHRANVFLASENNVMKLWFLEPQTDHCVEVKDYNKFVSLTGWKNYLNIFDF